MLEKTEGTIKNGQSRDTGNIWYIYKTQDKDKQNKKHNTVYYNLIPPLHQKPGGACKGKGVSASYKTHMKLWHRLRT